MTRTRRTTTPTVPLAERIRAALAQGWHTLAALDDMTGLRGSRARSAVHEALGEIAKSGATIEERTGAGGVEVRLVETGERDTEARAMLAEMRVSHEGDSLPCASTSTAPDGGPVTCQRLGGHDGQHEADFTGPMGKIGDLVHRWDDAPSAERKQCPSVWRGIRCEREEGHPCNEDGHHETKDRSIAIWTTEAADRWAASDAARLVPREPGPTSRCAVCEVVYAQHGADRGHPFAPKPCGRPRVKPIPDAAPAILPRAKQRKASGPIVDVDGGRVERAGDAEPRPTGRCRPPVCHADNIHEPARVRGFERPLCEAHRAWVERAGGTLAAS